MRSVPEMVLAKDSRASRRSFSTPSSIATLSEVISHYERGGRLIENGQNAGDGRLSPYKSEFVTGFELSEEEREDLVAFLQALTDETILTDERFANPHLN